MLYCLFLNISKNEILIFVDPKVIIQWYSITEEMNTSDSKVITKKIHM